MENIFAEYINPELMALVPVLYIMGCFLKKAAWFEDRFIPALLGLVGMILAVMWSLGVSEVYTAQGVVLALFTAIVQGFTCAGAAVYCNQLVKQGQRVDEHDE